MTDKTLTVGSLVLTQYESSYNYEVEGPQGLRLVVHLGWKHDVATATVQHPKGCNSVQSSGSYRSSIEGALNYMRQEIEQEVRRANKKLADFNAQSSEILTAIGEADDQSDQPHKKPNLCKCGAPGTKPHRCPYRIEISGNPEELCNCCSDCKAKCREEI